jgi:hypothetical protein
MGYMYWLLSILSRFFGGCSAEFFGKTEKVSRALPEGRAVLKLKAEKKPKPGRQGTGFGFFWK